MYKIAGGPAGPEAWPWARDPVPAGSRPWARDPGLGPVYIAIKCCNFWAYQVHWLASPLQLSMAELRDSALLLVSSSSESSVFQLCQPYFQVCYIIYFVHV